ncbi:hypothetical protein HHK36_008178 [Tetracentron sinense]|uniref:Uncharacterized protein n=1 Tax=Tetracentron sinense TaxID=13715 RepID=A0A835DJ25_TETSI|nr:hypothetical protein HHK36_008178 [Tetracentron sinense]
MYQAPSPYHGSGSWRSPIGMVSTFHRQQGTPPGSWNGSGGMASCGFLSNSSRGGGFSSPVYGRGGSPSPNSGRGRGRWFNSSSSPSSGRGGSPSPNSGRVRGRWFNSSPSHGSGQGGGRGQGFHANVSARERPEMFYTKSMVEDPWRLLKPVIRSLVVPAQSLNTPNSLRSWLSKSVSMKKTRISEAANDFSSQSSLAECLASSFEETVKDATSA